MQKNKEKQAKDAAAEKPGREDVHEQRESNQRQEGVVSGKPRPPHQSLVDEQRADWEGMGQSRYEPPPPAPQAEKRTPPTKR